jgi:DNA-binding NarL/FixJ family response regulator
MPGIGGLETIKRLVQRNEKINILVFSVHDEQVYITRALNAGAKGYITKNSAPEILPEAIESIYNGQRYIENLSDSVDNLESMLRQVKFL